jgi:hypothetical protein
MNAHRHAPGILLCLGLAGAAVYVDDIVYAQTKVGASDVRVTVIGCVQRSQQPRPEIVGTTIIPEGMTKYVLSNITLVPADDRAASRGNLVAQAVKMYRLDDSADSLLAPHVGDRVRVVGTVVTRPPSPTGTTGRTESPAIGGTSTPTLRVDSLQKISSDSSICSQ